MMNMFGELNDFAPLLVYAFNRLPEIISRAVLPADQTELL